MPTELQAPESQPVALSDFDLSTVSKMEIGTRTPGSFSKGFLFSGKEGKTSEDGGTRTDRIVESHLHLDFIYGL